jgi:superfamily II DNA or RNA helicase
MRVLHGIWADGALCVWAEDSAMPSHADGSGQHPFACEPPGLAELLEPVSDLAHKAVEAELMLALPAIAGSPVASPELVRLEAPLPGEPLLPGEPPPPAEPLPPGKALTRTGRRPRLSGWRVPVLRFEPVAACDLLAALAAPAALDVNGTGADRDVFTSGASISYLAVVARFAAGLAERGRVLPVLVAEDGGYAARWRPVLAGVDAQRARDLAEAMPPVCRAAAAANADPAGKDPAGNYSAGQYSAGQDPGELLTAAVAALADATARTRLPAALLPPRRGRSPVRIPISERYVAALTSTDARIQVQTPQDEAEAAALATELGEWLDGARMPAGPVRTCFRLREPADPGAGQPWRVEFTLQSAEDPSLMVSATDVWRGTAGADIGGGDPVEQLLTGLGGAARLFPELAGALREAAPYAVSLDTSEAFRFLKQTGPLLAGAGFGVLLPDWVRKARLGLKLTTRTKRASSGASASPGKFGMADLVDFRYELAVGDQSLDAGELAELARMKIPLVRLRGQWVELDEAHLTAALKFLESNKPGTMTAADALAAGLGLREQQEDPAVPLAVDADGWLGDLLSGQADQRLRPVPTPAGFTGTLRPYQERGLAWLSFLGELGLGGILADDMGLGKTVQLLSLIAANPAGPTLLICPMSLVGNWQREAAKFTPDLRVHVHHGADRLEGDELTAVLADSDMVISTYGVATRDRAALSEVHWARVVCDEAQNIKNHATRQAQAVRSLPAATRIALTGTPVENRLSELWSIMDFTNPGLLGPAEKFRQKYAIPVERQADADAAESLKRLTRPFCLRRLKTDRSIITDLPEKQEMKIWCNLTAEQASLYQATVDDMLAQIEAAEDDMSRRGLVLATMAKLKQVCNHPAHLLRDGSRLPGRSGKLARLEEICDEIVAEGDKALCFTQYAEFGRMLQPHLAARLGCPVLFLHGGTPKSQRDAMVASFGALDEPAIFLLSLKAGGTGLNLTAANHVIHVDRWWNPAVEDQATDRAFRIGQRKNVQVRKFVCVGTLEERIDAMIEEKKALADRIVGTGEGWLTELSVADLRAVLTLSPEAVSE